MAKDYKWICRKDVGSLEFPIRKIYQQLLSRFVLCSIGVVVFMSCTVNYRKWSIKRPGVYFIFPVIGAAFIQDRRLFHLRVKHWGEYRENKVKICIRDYDNLCRSFSVFTWNLSTIFIIRTYDLFDLTVSHSRLKKWLFLTKSLVESQVFRFYYECIYMYCFICWIMYWMLEDSATRTSSR